MATVDVKGLMIQLTIQCYIHTLFILQCNNQSWESSPSDSKIRLP